MVSPLLSAWKSYNPQYMAYMAETPKTPLNFLRSITFNSTLFEYIQSTLHKGPCQFDIFVCTLYIVYVLCTYLHIDTLQTFANRSLQLEFGGK